MVPETPTSILTVYWKTLTELKRYRVLNKYVNKLDNQFKIQ